MIFSKDLFLEDMQTDNEIIDNLLANLEFVDKLNGCKCEYIQVGKNKSKKDYYIIRAENKLRCHNTFIVKKQWIKF